MGRLRPLPFREVKRRLEGAGFVETTQRGSHVKFVRRQGDNIDTAIVPRKSEIPIGTLRSIYIRHAADDEAALLSVILVVMELIFEVRDAEEGGYWARALGHAIFTEGDTWEELRANVLEATTLHSEDGPVQARLVQLHYTKDELIPVEA